MSDAVFDSLAKKLVNGAPVSDTQPGSTLVALMQAVSAARMERERNLLSKEQFDSIYACVLNQIIVEDHSKSATILIDALRNLIYHQMGWLP